MHLLQLDELMKNQMAGDAACTSLFSPAGGGSVQVHYDYQKVAFQMRPGNVQRDSSTCTSGLEDDTLTQSSTLTLAENQQGVQVVRLKEFVLIDDEDDGDMSLREKTVTDMSTADGRAAQLVCGRVASSSTDSMSEEKEGEEAAGPTEAPPPEEEEQRQHLCSSCSIL